MNVVLDTSGEGGAFPDVVSFSRAVDDGEVRQLKSNNFLSSFVYKDVEKVISLILAKIRVGGEATFVDFDWVSIGTLIHQGVDIDEINKEIGSPFKCCLSIEKLVSKIPQNFEIVEKQYHNHSFIVKVKRVS